MDERKIILLFGVEKYGKTKSFNQILTEAGLFHDDALRIEEASALEDEELIEAVTYRYPVDIRAEISAKGVRFLDSIRATRDPV